MNKNAKENILSVDIDLKKTPLYGFEINKNRWNFYQK